MQDIMIRIQTDDFEAWKQQHYLHAASRARYGITDGPAYRTWTTLAQPCSTSASPTWTPPWAGFRSDTFREATKLAKVTGRRFYLAQPQT
jgi:hypothetical protein